LFPKTKKGLQKLASLSIFFARFRTILPFHYDGDDELCYVRLIVSFALQK